MCLTEDQEDALREIINIGIGRAAGTLSQLIGTRIELTVPRVALITPAEARHALTNPSGGIDIAIVQDFRGSISGRSALVLPQESGLRLAQLLGDVERPADELDLEMTGILTEVGNIMLNSVLGVLSNLIGTCFSYSVPQFFGNWPLDLLQPVPARGQGLLLTADADFWVRDAGIRGSILVAMSTDALQELLDSVAHVEV